MALQYFSDMDLSHIHDRCIVLDLDGTVVAASEAQVRPGTHAAVEQLKAQGNDVTIFSNSFDIARNREVACKLGCPYVESHLMKPNPRVMQSVPNPRKLKVVVIGDLWLTDGLFAIFTRSRYIRVRRIVPERRRQWWRLTLYFVDDVLWRITHGRRHQ